MPHHHTVALARFRFETDDVLIEGEGVLTVTRAPDDQRQTVLELLDGLDAAEIEREAMNQQGWGSGPLAEQIIAIIRKAITDA